MGIRQIAERRGFTVQDSLECLAVHRPENRRPQSPFPLSIAIASNEPFWPRMWPLLVQEHGEVVSLQFVAGYEAAGKEAFRLLTIKGERSMNDHRYKQLIMMSQFVGLDRADFDALLRNPPGVAAPSWFGSLPPVEQWNVDKGAVLQNIGSWLCDRINSNEPTEIANLGDFLREIGEPEKVFSAGLPKYDPSAAGLAFEAFATLFVERGRLPTSRDVREFLHIPSAADDTTRQDHVKALKSLGIILPRAKRRT